MNSSWRAEIWAMFLKEARTELRSLTGVSTAGLFGVVTVFTISLATFNSSLDGYIAAGLLWVGLLFSSVIALPRAFISEEEQRTGDLLRMVARPHAVFWGKGLYNLAQVFVLATVLSVLFVGFTGITVHDPWIYALSIIAGCAASAGAVTLCGALVARAANRSALAGAISIPILLPIMTMGVSSTGVGLGAGMHDAGLRSAWGLVAYAAATLAIGPWLFASVWKN